MSGAAGCPERGATPPAPPTAQELAQSIREDLSAAALGDLHRLRAGLGLLTLRALLPHGEWTEFLAERFPARAYRTMARYSADARRFCDRTGRDAAAAWAGLRGGDPARLLAAPGGGGSGGEPTLADDVRGWLFPDEDGGEAPARELTQEERRLAEADRVRRGLRDALAGAMGEWGRTAPTDELRDAEDSLRSAADALRIQLKLREEREGGARLGPLSDLDLLTLARPRRPPRPPAPAGEQEEEQ